MLLPASDTSSVRSGPNLDKSHRFHSPVFTAMSLRKVDVNLGESRRLAASPQSPSVDKDVDVDISSERRERSDGRAREELVVVSAFGCGFPKAPPLVNALLENPT